ncbi:MAG: cobalamin B12-binding domain-containing protein [Dethiobacter sp.]|jgi:methylmalonyl-CoA mutase cobalamin-binding domain/chain|nr:cobalamin B12-binding domain-containing protein [Dethiobacter sp.]
MSIIKKVVLAPMDPVHDIGLKMIRRGLEEAGHITWLYPPDYSPQEIIRGIMEHQADTVLISRTLGYGVEEVLARFVDLLDAAGLRERVKIAVGGMAIRPELAAELGFDGGFGPGTTVEETVAFVEGREYIPARCMNKHNRYNLIGDYRYEFKNRPIKGLLDQITAQILDWSKERTSPGVQRALLRRQILTDESQGESTACHKKEYASLCDDIVSKYYTSGCLHPQTRKLGIEELAAISRYVEQTRSRMNPENIRHTRQKPGVFVQYGTGCPSMDIAHIKASEAWGADGVVHFDPSWGARSEGFLEGYLTHHEDGSVITPENLKCIKESLQESTLWQVRAHRGVNTAETVLLAGNAGADLTKINIAYGCLGAGTDPERMIVDGVQAIKFAAQYGMPFDVVTNEELSGVPAYKAFAGMLIVSNLSLALGAMPILQPLFCYSPEVMINGNMSDNYIDFNVAKILALRNIINAPIWAGAPIGFLTQTEERVQSSVSTGLHAALAASLGVEAISIASSDEAYSGGPIAAASRIDTLKAVKEAFRFLGTATIEPTASARQWAEHLEAGIEQVLRQVLEVGDFAQALQQGVLGSREEGAYPGRAGAGTVYRV